MPPRKSCIGLIDPHAWKIPAREGGIPLFGEPSRLIFTLNQDKVSLPLRALQQAIATRHPPSGLVHHSDRGVQYVSEAYVAVLFKHLIIGSMSRKGYPYDNALCESFMRTLKEEEIYCSTYSDIDDLRKNLTYCLEVYYPLNRLHSTLGYQTIAEFEAGFLHPNWES